jgi:hypothetical protein
MSRFFDGQFAVESVSFSVGGTSSIDQGPCTIAALIRFNTSAAGALTYVVTGKSSGGADVWTVTGFDLSLFMANDFTSGSGQLTVSNWYWVAVSKANGTATPRWHIHNLTAGTAWTHTDASGTVADSTGPVTSIVVGNSAASAGDDFRGWMAATAVWSTQLADLSVEAACTLNASDLAAASPTWGALWNQSSTATSVSDFTAGGGNQTAISGTSVDGAVEPPGWSYSLSGGAAPVGRQLAPSQAVNRSNTY